MLDGTKARYLIADKGYDTDEILKLARKRHMIVVIPPKSNRKVQRYHYRELYRKRHRIENTFMKMKRWRGISTRYCKNIASYRAAVQICCFMMWASNL